MELVCAKLYLQAVLWEYGRIRSMVLVYGNRTNCYNQAQQRFLRFASPPIKKIKWKMIPLSQHIQNTRQSNWLKTLKHVRALNSRSISRILFSRRIDWVWECRTEGHGYCLSLLSRKPIAEWDGGWKSSNSTIYLREWSSKWIVGSVFEICVIIFSICTIFIRSEKADYGYHDHFIHECMKNENRRKSKPRHVYMQWKPCQGEN